MKKRKLGSKNPKYNTSLNEDKQTIVKKVPFTGKAKGYGAFYTDEKVKQNK